MRSSLWILQILLTFPARSFSSALTFFSIFAHDSLPLLEIAAACELAADYFVDCRWYYVLVSPGLPQTLFRPPLPAFVLVFFPLPTSYYNFDNLVNVVFAFDKARKLSLWALIGSPLSNTPSPFAFNVIFCHIWCWWRSENCRSSFLNRCGGCWNRLRGPAIFF